MKFSLVEKVNGLTKALEGAEEKHRTVYQELDRVKAELAHTETECVLCGLKSMMFMYYYVDMPLVYYVI